MFRHFLNQLVDPKDDDPQSASDNEPDLTMTPRTPKAQWFRWEEVDTLRQRVTVAMSQQLFECLAQIWPDKVKVVGPHRYREVHRWVGSHIIQNANRFFKANDPSMIDLKGDPLGQVFGREKVHRSEVGPLIRRQLVILKVEDLPLGASNSHQGNNLPLPPLTDRETAIRNCERILLDMTAMVEAIVSANHQLDN